MPEERTERGRDEELGALWLKDGQRGEYLSGHININGERIPLVCFRPARPGGNNPEWRIVRARNQTNGQRRENSPRRDYGNGNAQRPRDYESW